MNTPGEVVASPHGNESAFDDYLKIEGRMIVEGSPHTLLWAGALVVSGLAQTPQYIKSLYPAMPRIRDQRRVAIEQDIITERLARQELVLSSGLRILYLCSTDTITKTVDICKDPTVAAEQVAALGKLGTRPNTTLRLVPSQVIFGASFHAPYNPDAGPTAQAWPHGIWVEPLGAGTLYHSPDEWPQTCQAYAEQAWALHERALPHDDTLAVLANASMAVAAGEWPEFKRDHKL